MKSTVVVEVAKFIDRDGYAKPACSQALSAQATKVA